jgi:hypothetical protein
MRPVTPKPITYSIKNDLPDYPDVRLVFEGLLWFVFHGSDECQVGIHNTTHGSMAHDHQHDLDIKTWRIESGCGTQSKVCKLLVPPYHIGNPKLITGIQIDVNRPAVNMDGVHVYQKDIPQGGSMVPEDRDWRWVIEFEKAPLYADGILIDDTKVYPCISINHGRFYTLYRTRSTYKLTPTEGGGAPIGVDSVALLVGANIYLDTGGDVTLTIRRRYPLKPLIRRYPKIADKCHQIDIRNTCVKGGKRCKPDDYGANENDFYLYNETFAAVFGEPKYKLERVTHNTAGDLPKDICFVKDDEPVTRSNNDAPCGPVSAGGGGGG